MVFGELICMQYIKENGMTVVLVSIRKINLFSDVDIVGFDFQYGKYVKSVYNADCDRIYYEDKFFCIKNSYVFMKCCLTVN